MVDTIDCKLPYLPRTANDGDEVCDKYGNRWRFDSDKDGWISYGVITPPPTVTESTNGLVTPAVFSQIQRVKQYFTNNNPQPLKLVPGTDAYWYYFKSSDKFIKFRPEAEDALRIEVDTGRFFQVIMKEVCQGPRGATGAKGKTGRAGLPGPAELCYQPIIDNNRLDFAIYTPAPLVDRTDIVLPNNHVPDISIRLYRAILPTAIQNATGKLTLKKLQQRQKDVAIAYDQLQHLAIYYHSHDDIISKFQSTRDLLRYYSIGASNNDILNGIPLSRVLVLPTGASVSEQPSVTILIDPLSVLPIRITNSNDILIDVEKSASTIIYNRDTNIVSGSLFLQSGVWDDLWCVKSRQKGPDGKPGSAGESTIKIVECQLDSTNIVATCPIVNVRLDCNQSTILTMCSDVVSDVCVQKVRIPQSTLPVSDKSALDAVFASAQMIVDDCKRIYRYKVVLGDDELDDLNLPHWDPQPGCLTKRHYNRHNFDWMSKTNVAACTDPLAKWYDPNMIPRSGAYPHQIIVAPSPLKDECSQDDFFYCPNVQGGGCADTEVSGTPAPPSPPPPPPPPPPPGVLTTDFTWSPLQPIIGQSIKFTQTTSGGLEPYAHNWNFGDGNSSITVNPTYSYAVPGVYTVTLTVTDSEGTVASKSYDITVSDGNLIQKLDVNRKSRRWRI